MYLWGYFHHCQKVFTKLFALLEYVSFTICYWALELSIQLSLLSAWDQSLVIWKFTFSHHSVKSYKHSGVKCHLCKLVSCWTLCAAYQCVILSICLSSILVVFCGNESIVCDSLGYCNELLNLILHPSFEVKCSWKSPLGCKEQKTKLWRVGFC